MKILSLMIVLVLVSACGKESQGLGSQPVGPSHSSLAQREVSAESCVDRTVGEVFLAQDGYNTCECNAKGEALCTLIAVSQ